MQFCFTAAAERALVYGSGWVSRAGHDELGVQALLVGLLMEPECRAAIMLAKHAVDLPAVRQQWPTLTPLQATTPHCSGVNPNTVTAPQGGDSLRGRFSTDVECSIQAACDRLDFLPRPLELATEHLLLGLAAADHEVAVWLRQRGLDPDAIEAEIRRVYGYIMLPDALACERTESMYERFTDRARRVMQLANQEAQRFNHEYIGTEHILLGLVKEGSGVAANVLKNLDVDLRKIRLEVEKLIQSGPDKVSMGKLPQTPRTKKVIEYAMEESKNLRHNYVGTEHILLGLLREQEGVAAQILMNLGVKREVVRKEVLNLLGYGIEGADDFQRYGLVPIAPSGKPAGRAGSPQESTALRVLDAAANRAREGLRVVEDCVRFVFDDRHLTELCKQLRHDLTDALSRIPADNLLAARETQADVGTSLSTSSERRRDDVAGILRANFARLQEALRSLEEFDKLLDGHTDVFEQLRYRAYTLERAVEITRSSPLRLTSARLYVLLDGRQSPEEFERLARSLIEAGVHAIQLRDKRLDDRELLGRARLLRALIQGTATLFVMNDRPDLAALARADGVHLGQNDLSVKDARSIVGPEALLGVSTHNIEQARQAVLDGANYIGVGPVFPSETKQFEQFPGVELLRAVAAEIGLPAFAIGGITRENLSEVLATGFTRIAVSGAIASADDPAQAARELLEILGKHHEAAEDTEIGRKI